MQVSPKVGNPNVGFPYVGNPDPLVRLRGSKTESSKDMPTPGPVMRARMRPQILINSSRPGPLTNRRRRPLRRLYASGAGPPPLAIAHNGQTSTGSPRSTPSLTRNRTPQ